MFTSKDLLFVLEISAVVFLITSLSIASLLVQSDLGIVTVERLSFVENFTNTAFLDLGVTTADIDTRRGEIRIPPLDTYNLNRHYLDFVPYDRVQLLDSTTGFGTTKFPSVLIKTENAGESWSNITPYYLNLDLPEFVNKADLLFAPVSDNVSTNFFFFDSQKGWVTTGSGDVWKTIDGGKSWQQKTTPLSGNFQLYNLHFASSLSGVAVGESGKIITTNDGGETWTERNSGTTNHLIGVHCPSVSVCYAVGDLGTIVKSIDAGITWFPLVSGTTDTLFEVEFADELNGWVTKDGITNTVLHTSDGTNWTVQSTDPGTGRPLYLSVVSATEAWLGKDPTSFDGDIQKTTDAGNTWIGVSPPSGLDLDFFGPIGLTTNFPYRTTDGGNSWSFVGWGPRGSFESESFVDYKNGWAVTNTWGLAPEYFIIRTSDGGQSWTIQLEPPNRLRDILMIDKQTGYAVGERGQIFKTTDGGATWRVQVSGTSTDLVTIDCIDSQRCWTGGGNIGSGGVILKTENGGATWISQTLPSCSSCVVRGISFADENVGLVAAGGAGAYLYTTNGGLSWFARWLPIPSPVESVEMVTPTLGFVSISNFERLYRCNGPANCTTSVFETSYWNFGINGISFIDSQNGAITTRGSGAIYITKDGGTTWNNRGLGCIELTENKLRMLDIGHIYQGNCGFLTRAQYPLTSMVIQSGAIDTADFGIDQAVLTADYDANGGTVNFFLSNDGGRTFYPTRSMVNFPSALSDLRWRAEITSNGIETPVIRSVTIDYQGAAAAPAPSPPLPTEEGRPGALCGNAVCEAGETTDSCPSDCPPTGPYCGDNICSSEIGETAETCSVDCAIPPPKALLTPGKPQIIRLSPTKIKLIIDPAGNIRETLFTIEETISGNFVQEDGSLGPERTLQTFEEWGAEEGIVVTVKPNTRYKFRVIARKQ